MCEGPPNKAALLHLASLPR